MGFSYDGGAGLEITVNTKLIWWTQRKAKLFRSLKCWFTWGNQKAIIIKLSNLSKCKRNRGLGWGEKKYLLKNGKHSRRKKTGWR